MKYFTESIEYPDLGMFLVDGLSEGVLYEYVSNTFLDGWINYVKPVRAFVMERYRILEKDKIEETLKQDSYHSRLSVFGDDVVLLAKIKDTDHYALFWFDCDVSDCCIGIFRTSDSQELVEASFVRYVKRLAEYNCGSFVSEPDGGPGYTTGQTHEIPVSYIKGWVSF